MLSPLRSSNKQQSPQKNSNFFHASSVPVNTENLNLKPQWEVASRPPIYSLVARHKVLGSCHSNILNTENISSLSLLEQQQVREMHLVDLIRNGQDGWQHLLSTHKASEQRVRLTGDIWKALKQRQRINYRECGSFKALVDFCAESLAYVVKQYKGTPRFYHQKLLSVLQAIEKKDLQKENPHAQAAEITALLTEKVFTGSSGFWLPRNQSAVKNTTIVLSDLNCPEYNNLPVTQRALAEVISSVLASDTEHSLWQQNAEHACLMIYTTLKYLIITSPENKYFKNILVLAENFVSGATDSACFFQLLEDSVPQDTFVTKSIAKMTI